MRAVSSSSRPPPQAPPPQASLMRTLLAVLSEALVHVLRGVRDALALYSAVRDLTDGTEEARQARTAISSSLLFWLIYVLIGVAYPQCVAYGARMLFTDALAMQWGALTAFDTAVRLAVMLMWSVPAYIVSLILCMQWFNEVAQAMHAKRKHIAMPMGVREKLITSLYMALWSGVLAVLCVAFDQLPWPTVRIVLTVCYNSWFNAFYALNLVLNCRQVPVRRRVRSLEHYCFYFLGLGLPVTLLTLYLPFFLGNAVLMAALPFLVVIVSSHRPPNVVHIRFPTPVMRPTEWVLKFVPRALGSSAA